MDVVEKMGGRISGVELMETTIFFFFFSMKQVGRYVYLIILSFSTLYHLVLSNALLLQTLS